MAEQRELLVNSISEANALLSPAANATPEQLYDAVVYLLAQAAFGRIARGILLKLYNVGAVGLSEVNLTEDETEYMRYIEHQATK